ncbi:hypothetical protein [Microbacterium sp. GXS0129]|uniref:hypothetical protein n=1 Tax=Microbacterium sp. GXS0129 TaxID=3377836 RepID=UPI00383BB8EF
MTDAAQASATRPPFRGRIARTLAELGIAESLTNLLLPAASALPVAPATDRDVWDGIDETTRAALLDSATADLGTPWPVPLARDAARYHRDGNREEYERAVFRRQERVSRAVVAAALTGADVWLDEAADGLWLLCEQSTWCWPAHDDTRQRHGAVLATVTDPFLDLGAGELVAQLAWADHVLGDALDARYPGLRTRIRHESWVRVFEPFLRRQDWHWIGLERPPHNWNPWIHGNVLVAALRLLDDDPDMRARVIELVVDGLDRYVSALPEDGAIDEGYAYWWNGALRALEALDVLEHATGGRARLTERIGALRETVAFPHRCHLGGDWYLNLADGQARPTLDQPWHALHRAARAVGDHEAQAHAATHRDPLAPAATEISGLGRLLRGITDPLWRDARSLGSPLPRDVFWPSTEVLVARGAAGSAAGLTLAVKGGNNDENHNHDDVGEVIVARDGVPVLIDAGRPTYTAVTFSPQRYTLWPMQSGWHSVPVIDGAEQDHGAQFAAADVDARVSDDASTMSLQLAGAYPPGTVSSWVRSAALDRATGTVSIVDSWTPGVPAVQHLLVAGTVRLETGGACVTPIEGAGDVRLRWSGGEARLSVRTLDDPLLREVWGESVTRIEIPAGSHGESRITVELVRAEAEEVR